MTDSIPTQGSSDASKPRTRAEWFEVVEQITSLAELMPLLDRLDGADGSSGIPPDDVWYLERRLFERATELTRDTPELAVSVVVDRLLSRTIETTDNISQEAKVGRSLLRDQLKEWIEQYGSLVTPLLRDVVLDHLMIALKSQPSAELVWIIASLGIWRADLDEALWTLATSKYATPSADAEARSLKDQAVNVLAALAPSDIEGRRVVEYTLLQLNLGVTFDLFSALARLAHLISLEDVHQAIAAANRASDGGADPAGYGVTMLVGSVIAAHREESEYERGLFAICSSLAHDPRIDGWLALGGGLLPQCDVSDVPATLLELAFREAKADRPRRDDELITHVQYLWQMRAAECLYEQHLEGWRRDECRRISAELLAGIARSSSGAKPEWRQTSSGMTHKEQAWELVMRAGLDEAVDWLDVAIDLEQNGFVQHHILELAAGLPITELPRSVATILGAPLPSASVRVIDDARYFAQSAAVELAELIVTRFSFLAVLRTTFNHKGHALRPSANALSTIAKRLAGSSSDEEIWVTEQLRRMLNDDEAPSWQQSAAMSALVEVLAARASAANGLTLWTLLEARLTGVLGRNILDPVYHTGLLVAALSVQGSHVPPQARAQLRSWAAVDDTELGWRSVEALLAVGEWNSHTAVLRSRLRAALQAADARETRRLVGGNAGKEWAARCLGQVFVQDPATAKELVAEIVRRGDWLELEQLKPYLLDRRIGASDRSFIVDALFDRAQRTTGPYGVETAPLTLLSTLAPERLLALVRDQGQHWTPSARVIVAELLRQVGDPGLGDVGLDTLVTLASDSAPSVQRAAVESLRIVAPNTLSLLINEWAESSNWRDRVRAIQACAFVPRLVRSENSAPASTDQYEAWERAARTAKRAIYDPEPRVFGFAQKASEERSKRLAADSALGQVISSLGAGRTPIELWHLGDCLRDWGDAVHAEGLRRCLRDSDDVRTRWWLIGIAKAIDKRLEKAASSMEPGLPADTVSAQLAEAVGIFDGREHAVPAMVWHGVRPADGNSQLWGGLLDVGAGLSVDVGQELTLRFDTGTERSVTVQSRWGTRVFYSGSGLCPLDGNRPALPTSAS